MASRRDLLKAGAIAAMAGALPSSVTFADPIPEQHKPVARNFWPDGARMVISVSLQMEGGAQPASGAESPMPKIDPKYPDLPASKWYDYGFKEGPPRLLDVFDRRKIKVTSHMVGAAVDLHPALAKEIVQRGHEATGHGQTWTAQFSMTLEEERASYQQSIESIVRATGTRPVGFNAFWLRGTPSTLEILQSLGFIYHIDYVSRDEPFLVNVRDKPFAVVPYTLHMNDIVDYETRYFSTAMYADDLKAEFDALYAEAGTPRRMMSVSPHDRIAGRPARSKVLEEFILYGQSHPGLAFLAKELIARAIHGRSRRKNRTFVKLNCAAIPTGLLESELFGHEKGAFTGAITQKMGRLELADQGTLFLDEVGDIPIEIQPKLLRALQEREFERLGSTHTRKVNVRLVAATNRDLEKMIAAREFHSHLYYRLNVFPIRIPPLRERKPDIPLLVSYFVQKFAKQMQKKIESIPAVVMKALTTWGWTGKVRELENIIERAVMLPP